MATPTTGLSGFRKFVRRNPVQWQLAGLISDPILLGNLCMCDRDCSQDNNTNPCGTIFGYTYLILELADNVKGWIKKNWLIN